MTPDSSRNRRHCLLFPQSLSTVPLYADESDCGKSNFLFSASASVSILYRHAEWCGFLDEIRTIVRFLSYVSKSITSFCLALDSFKKVEYNINNQ